MPLTEEQKKNIDAVIMQYFNEIKYPQSNSQKSTALELILRPSDNINFAEAAALNLWQASSSDKKDSALVPLLPSVLNLRAYLKNPEQISSINNEDTNAARDYIKMHVEARMNNLNMQGQGKAEIPPLDTVATVAFTITLLSHMLPTSPESKINTALEMANIATNSVIYSENPIIRNAIDYGLKGVMVSLLKTGSINEVAVGAVAGAVGGYIMSNAPEQYQKIVNAAVDEAIGGLTANANNSVQEAVYRAAAASMAAAVAVHQNQSYVVPSVVAASALDLATTNDLYKAALGGVSKAAYNYGWKQSQGGIALNDRDLNNFVNARIASSSLGKYASSSATAAIISTMALLTKDHINQYLSQSKKDLHDINSPELQQAAATLKKSKLTAAKANAHNIVMSPKNHQNTKAKS